jgi:hypothetical protein
MKAEISQIGLYRERRFTGVYQQQGRMMLDRDWNEACDILRDLGNRVGDEAIGTGVPRHEGLLTNASTGLTLRNAGGRVAASGLIAEVLPRDTAAGAKLYTSQLDLPDQVHGPKPGELQPLLKGSPNARLLYVDVWERPVTAFEISDLIDPALHGADTCLRTQRVAQIKAATIDDLDKLHDPCLAQFFADRIPTKGNAEFMAQLTPAGKAVDECDPCAVEVMIARSVANHLFRLEVHSVDFDTHRRPNRIILKWSRDNGARELRLAEFASTNGTGHSYEYFSDATERLLGTPSDDWAAEEFLRGVLDPADPARVTGALPRVREWGGWCELRRLPTTWTVADGRYAGKGIGAAAAIGSGALNVRLDDVGFSFSLALTGKNFLAGDYWLALVRARAPVAERVRVITTFPLGIEHRYCILGVATVKDGDIAFEKLSAFDLRRLQHPSLTCLDASDVGYSADCPSRLFGATDNTVKKALDRVCHIGAEHVAFVPDPNCKDLKGKGNVAAALNALCSLDLPVIRRVSWKNDTTLSFTDFKAGLRIEFSEDILIDLVSSDVLIVTWELALDLPRRLDIIGHTITDDFLTPQIVTGTITPDPPKNSARGTAIKYTPHTNLTDAGFKVLKDFADGKNYDRPSVRCRVRLMGRSVFAAAGTTIRPLDGYVPMKPSKPIELNFDKAGLGQPSDFESWFYVVT